MKQLHRIILILALPISVVAQNMSFRVDADTNRILIGEHIKLHLQAEFSTPQDYQWPVLPDTLEGLEIVKSSKIDTIKKDGKWMLQQEIRLTSFDSGYFAIPPMVFSSKNQNLESEAIGIAVDYPEISEDQDYFDIKKPLEVGLNWWMIILWTAIALLFIAGVILLIRFLGKKRKKENIPPELLIDPDIYAIQELDKLEKEQVWQKGLTKEYYSRLIDILRIYLERQMGFSAMESTADEIIEDLKKLRLEKDLYERLKNTLRLSAMVKFAKEKPGPEENENSIIDIRDFIEKTRPEKTEKENVD